MESRLIILSNKSRKKRLATKALVAAIGATGALAIANTAHADTDVTVQQGDTVSKYAQQYDTTVDAIVNANKLQSADVIHVGQRLHIPTDKVNDANDQSGQFAQTAADAATNQSTGVGTNNDDTATISDTANNANNTTQPTATTYTPSNTYGSNSGYTGSNNYSDGNSGVTNTTAVTATAASTSVGHGATYSPAQAVQRAQGQLGVPYVWGGTTPGKGLDCSGLVQYAYGLDSSHRTTYQQQALGAHHYDVQNAQAGDLYFWGSDSAPYHTAIAEGNGNYIQAPRPGQNVQQGNINYYRPNYYVSMQ